MPRVRYAILNVLNFGADGHPFTNNLSLHPIEGASGDYRYSLGVLVDISREESQSADAKAAIVALRAAVPLRASAEDGDAHKKAAAEMANGSGQIGERAALLATWRAVLVKLLRLIYSLGWRATLTQLLSLEAARKAFHKWMLKYSADNVVMFEVTYEVDIRLSRCTPKQAARLSLELASRYLEEPPTEPERAIELLRERADIAASDLAERCLPKFVQSKGCLPLIESLVGADVGPAAIPPPLPEAWCVKDALDGGYSKDVTAWLHGVCSFGVALPYMLSVSDMSAEGNPLIFVNEAFCRVSGYERSACLGRNCRFLQGPATEAQSVAVIQTALRDVADCVVKITNYRKTGEAFEMLLALRPVADLNGSRRFCVGLHFEITPALPLKQVRHPSPADLPPPIFPNAFSSLLKPSLTWSPLRNRCMCLLSVGGARADCRQAGQADQALPKGGAVCAARARVNCLSAARAGVTLLLLQPRAYKANS